MQIENWLRAAAEFAIFNLQFPCSHRKSDSNVLLEVKNSPFFLSMPIHFVCSCGKHLKARRRLAGWISFCPACGEHVVIPTGKATHSGIAEIGKPAPVVDSSMMSELPGECQPGLLVAPADDSVGRRSQAAAASSGRAPG